MSVFPHLEYLNRIQWTKQAMINKEIDVLVTSSPENMNYLSGYSGWSFYTPQVLILSLEAEQPLLILRGIDTPCAEFTTFLYAENIVGYPEPYITDIDKHPMSFIVDMIKSHGWDNKRLGIEMEAFFLTAHGFLLLKKYLPDTELIDAGLLINWVRLIKSDREIEALRQAGCIAEKAMEVAIEEINPDVRECDVAAKIYATQISGTTEFGGSVPVGVVISTGAKTSAPHLSWSDDVFKNDQAINVELGGSRFQYHCGLARSVYLGKPPQSLVNLASTVVDGLNQSLESIKPGVLCEDIESEWRDVIFKRGYHKDSRIGYSIGLGFQPIWVEGTASLCQGDKTRIEKNMVFHVICGMWSGEDNFVISETVSVTDSGYELLTHLERKLFVK